jgi:hypothetical protein
VALKKIRITAGLLVVMGLFACKREGPQTAAAPATDTVSRGVVDSIFTVEEDIARFKAARANAAARELTGGAASRDALVQRFIRAVETRDTADLRAMVLSDAEFIDLYYPTSMYVKPPYRQSPDLVWFLMQESGGKGFRRVLERFGGRESSFTGYVCAEKPIVRDVNRFYGACTVRRSAAPGHIRLFGPIIERNGQFKFLSYANDL